MTDKFRVTYATLTADNEDMHKAYDGGLELARTWFGQVLPTIVNGEERTGSVTHDVTSPVDTRVTMCTIHEASTQDVHDAIASAKSAKHRWGTTPWQDRIAILRKAADLISERSNELGALMSMEVGKNRLEALGDVEESADLIRYYCDMMDKHDGFVAPMDTLNPAETTQSVMRPYGVWGVISPFNFPMALAAGPAGGALAAGNTVVLKPSAQGSFSAYKLWECFRDAGLPADVFHLVLGEDEPGKAIVDSKDIDGITFTGSYPVGMHIFNNFASAYPKPVICEMGGKNPTIVSTHADIDKAVAGITRSAFGLTGQKCSACSRVYVARDKYDALLEGLKAAAEKLVIGDATARDTFMGPVINDDSVKRFEEAVALAQRDGRVVTGGEVLGKTPDGTPGHYLTPTIVTDLPVDHDLFQRELFLPFVAVAPIDTVDEGLTLANDTDLGLTAGFFSEDQSECEKFMNTIEAGVIYVNRPAGATTGAWPGVQPFGGWKGSGTYGNGGGSLYYVQQFMREQSRSVVS